MYIHIHGIFALQDFVYFFIIFSSVVDLIILMFLQTP